MSRSVLIGRSVKQAGALVPQIAERQITGIYQALLTVEKLPGPPDIESRLNAAQAVVVTSTNAVGQLAAMTRKRFMPVLAVGDGTAHAAYMLGFVDVTSAHGDAAALLNLCRTRLKKGHGAVLYLRGREVAHDLAPVLTDDGYDVDSVVVYATELTPQFRPPVEQQLRRASIEATILFSPRGAANFVSLIRQAGIDYTCAGMTLIAFSPAIAAVAGEMVWRLQLVTEKPTIPALLATLEQWRDGKFAG